MAKKIIEAIEHKSAYTKQQILSSKKYNNRRDILGVLLNENEEYTFSDVDSLLDKFMKGKVN